MNATGKLLGLVVLVTLIATGGCTKKVDLTVYNHSPSAIGLKVTTPDAGTMSIGTVNGDGGRLSHPVRVKNEDFPAQVTLSAGMGNSQSFTVTEDTRNELWFHVTESGRLAGPYEKDDVHVETEDAGEMEVTIERGTVVR